MKLLVWFKKQKDTWSTSYVKYADFISYWSQKFLKNNYKEQECVLNISITSLYLL